MTGEPLVIPGWAMLAAPVVYVVAERAARLAFKAREQWVGRDEFDKAEAARDRRCNDCHQELRERVSVEALRLQLEPIRAEQEHRRRQMDVLGQTLTSRINRMDRAIVRIAAKLGVADDEPSDGQD